MPLAGGRPIRWLGRGLLALGLILCAFVASADIVTLGFFVSYAAVGAVLVVRRPRNRVSWLVLALGIGFIPTTSRPGMDTAALIADTESTVDFLLEWFGSWGGSATFLGFVALMIVFPTGHLPTGRWRWPAIAVLAAGATVVALIATAPVITFNPDGVADITIRNRLAVLPDLGFWTAVPVDGSLVFFLVALMGVAAVSLLARYRRSAGVLRLQLRWLVAAVTFLVVALLSAFVALALFGDMLGGAVWLPAIAAYPTVPIAIGVAITRYRLFEIDRIISRTIGWALLTVILAGVFAATIVGLQSALAPLTGNNTLAVAASTLIAAALSQPLRRRVQRAVDRRFNRSRVQADRAAVAFASHVRSEVDLAALRSALVATAGDAVHPDAAAVWLRTVPDRGRQAAS